MKLSITRLFFLCSASALTLAVRSEAAPAPAAHAVSAAAADGGTHDAQPLPSVEP